MSASRRPRRRRCGREDRGRGGPEEHGRDPGRRHRLFLKKRTLVNLYSARPTWLANAHVRLDRAVWDTHDWSPEEVEEVVVFGWLLDLHREWADVATLR